MGVNDDQHQAATCCRRQCASSSSRATTPGVAPTGPTSPSTTDDVGLVMGLQRLGRPRPPPATSPGQGRHDRRRSPSSQRVDATGRHRHGGRSDRHRRRAAPFSTEERLASWVVRTHLTREQHRAAPARRPGRREGRLAGQGHRTRETTGHVDDVAGLGAAGGAGAVTRTKTDRATQLLQDNLRRSRDVRTPGRKLEVITVTDAGDHGDHRGRAPGRRTAPGLDRSVTATTPPPAPRTSSSSTGIILPTFDDPNDAVARELIAVSVPPSVRRSSRPRLDEYVLACGRGALHRPATAARPTATLATTKAAAPRAGLRRLLRSSPP